MIKIIKHKKRGERGIAVMLSAIFLILAIPMVGLVFDGTLVFVIKDRLQGAVDGAALAGARALARGADGSAQILAAQNEATAYVKMNYQNGYLFSNGLTISPPTVDTSVAFQRTVSVTAQASFPAFFLRYINTNATTVAATASATRKDVNVMMVLDRSGSMTASGSCAPMQAASTNFVNFFAPQRDNVGLVTFASSINVDFPLANTFSPGVANAINSLVCQGSTSTAAAIWQAYQQLATLNQPGALNVILLFTDGDPTGVTVHMPVANGSPCTAFSPGALPSLSPDYYPMPGGGKGYLQGVYNTFANANQFFGLLKESNGGVITNGDINAAVNSDFCTFAQGWSGQMTNTSDFLGVPVTDIYGNSMNSGYQAVTLTGNGFINLGNSSNAPAMALNAGDSAATRIRNGAVDPITGRSLNNIVIFTIGLGNATVPPNGAFLVRVANDPASPIYDSAKPAGSYIFAATAADLQPAFQKVASEILRIAK